jgi:single-stranded-DNA-specific exonuclease
MSLQDKVWKIINQDPSRDIIEKILENRGFSSKAEVETFIKANIKKGFHNPFLMRHMDRAVERINKAIKLQERIMIFGDYDVDGISGTAILVHTLKLLGAKVSYRLPHRVEDGYGLNSEFIKEFVKLKIDLLITVDCGISCKDQIQLAQSKGIDVIITDHHTIPDAIPDRAYAILHPSQPQCDYPFKGLTGAGVAFKLASALLTDRLSPKEKEKYLYSLLDLASLGTVADLGPLRGENRIIVKHGLEALRNTKWLGLNYLMQYAGIDPESKIDVNTIGFAIGPRINAAGRIANPYYALQLLLYDNPDEKGAVLAEHLDKLNKVRQEMVADALEELKKEYFKNVDQDNDKIFIAWSPNWHVGILGLLASKFVEKYSYPCIVMHDFGDYLVGSGRSPEYFDLVQAFNDHSKYLMHYGGHVQAAGFSIEKKNVEPFSEALKKYAKKHLDSVDFKPILEIDCEINENEISDSLVNFLDKMKPFGVGNEQPVFLLKNVQTDSIKRVGKELNHLHFRAITGRKNYPVIGFKLGNLEGHIKENQKVDLVCHVEKNEWKGNTKIQLRVLDIGLSN